MGDWRKRKAIAPIVSALLLVSIAVAGGIMVTSWASGMLGGFQRGQSQTFDEKAEAIVIENVWFFDNGTVQVVVRNVGAANAAIGAVYVDGMLKYSAPSPQGVIINIGGSVSLLLSGVSMTAHLFDVATLKGNSASGQWAPVVVVTTVTVTTITFTTTYTTVTTMTTTYQTTSRFTTTYMTTTVITTTSSSTHQCECHVTTITTTTTMPVTSTGTTTITTTRTTTSSSTVTTVITTTSNAP